MRIAILGSGGVGGYYGGRLAATGTDISFIARGAHLAAMRTNGLRILSPSGDVHVPHVNVTDDPAAIGPVDIVFFTVKLYDTDSAIKMLPPLLGPQTLVIPFQNGVDSVDVLTRAVGREHVAGGTAYVSAVIAQPGVIRHTAMGRLIFGMLDGSGPALLEELLQACARAGIDATLSDRIMAEVWAKFARLTVFSGMTSVTRSPIGVVCGDPELFAMMEMALRESIAVARAKKIPLPAGLYDEVVGSLRSLPPHAKASMLEDLERGRPIELPWLSGAMVRIGQEVGVDTPTHHLITTLLRPHINGHSRP
jgi:2-dehydropantoate 2-reductase